MNQQIKRQIRLVAFSMLGLLTVLFAYIAYIQVFRHDFWLTHSLNRRTLLQMNALERGKILDRTGKVIAQSVRSQSGTFIREYPYEEVLAPLIGYESIKYGRAGLEAAYNAELAGFTAPARQIGPASRLLADKVGNSIQLTLDADWQERAYESLGNHRGAVVVLDVKTGAVLVSVSKPGFIPNAIDKEWNTISTAKDSPLLNRAVQGLYPPGSIAKVIIADAALQENPQYATKYFLCEGQLKVAPDYVLNEANHSAHGKVNLEQALAVSCNVTFGSLALELGRTKVAAAYERFGFLQPAADLQEASSRLPSFSTLGNGDLAQTGIGQSGLLTTPLKMATIAAAFANKGMIMKPFIVNTILSPTKEELFRAAPKEWLRATPAEFADRVASMMKTAVKQGTGRQAGYYSVSVSVAGKTGTAENPHGEPHAWFMGFAPADNPRIAIVVIVENAGSGGAVAAPIAGKIVSYMAR